MRFLAYDSADGPMIGAVDDGTVRRLCGLQTFYQDPFGPIDSAPTGADLPVEAIAQIPPVPPTAQILCIGLNYAAHIEETGRDRPEAPNIFARWYATLSCADAEVPVPSGEPGLDWEGELAVVIGREMTDVTDDEAMAGVLGYTCFNDISARTYQRRTPQWALGKNATRSGPIGPVVVTADELGDPYGLRLETRYNGETVQSTTTDHMIFGVGETLAYASRCVTLRPGDVLATGTPAGVGSRRDPPVLMTAGDEVEVEIERIGTLRTKII
ncbi:MAG: fumarylacetoacetate hydrolase family protein [Acidimicrobiia bacterium]|nr:fumarylacetoacetate hydrolase family protein [Acidimicrobiia bacterium]